MTQLPVKLALFAALMLAVRLVFPPVYKSEYEYRVDAVAERPYSVVFMGTSRTKYAVIPAYFDQLLQDETISSYNFGIDMGLMQVAMDWGENLIDMNPSLRHVIIEITEKWELASIERQIPGKRRSGAGGSAIMGISTQVDNTVLWMFKPGMPWRDVTFADHNHPLNELIEPCARKNTSEFDLQAAAGRSRFIELGIPVDQSKQLPDEYRVRIRDFIDYAESRGVSVHFFVPPLIRQQSEVEMIGMIYRSLPTKNKIAVNLKGPIYSMDNTADTSHPNQKGAFAFTRSLADEFAKTRK